MNRKQFALVLAAVALLVAAGVGQKLIEGFKVDDVGTIDIVESKGRVSIVRGERGWTVKERGDFPADVEPIRDLLLKLQGLKVVQAEGLSDAVKPRLQLVAPGAGVKPEEAGTLVELKARDGKPLATLVLGKKQLRDAKIAGLPDGMPSGRYVWVAADPQRVSVVNEAFGSVVAKPEQWLAKELVRIERTKAITATGPDGKVKWAVSKASEAGDWKLAGPGTLDPQKAQDAASALYGVQVADVAPDISDAEAGLDKPTTIRAQTFEGWNYELKIGKPAPGDRYFVRASVDGSVPEPRAAPADDKLGEKPQDKPEDKPEGKEKADKALADRKDLLAAKLAREQAVAGRTVLVGKSIVAPLLRDRGELYKVAKPKDAAKARK